MPDIDARIQKWLNRFNTLSEIFQRQMITDIQDYLTGKPMTVRMAQTGLIIRHHHAQAYSLDQEQQHSFEQSAHDFASHSSVLNNRFENLRKWFGRMNAPYPDTHYLTYAKNNNQIDTLFFCYEVVRNDTGIPLASLCDFPFKNHSVELSHEAPNAPRYRKVAQFKAVADPVFTQTLSVEPGKNYMLYLYDGYGMRGRKVIGATDPSGKPCIGPLEMHRS